MRGELLSIGEVSKMKGVSIKSLRYYERVGVLTPAHVDPQSGYRYYAMRQMADIDVIMTCIDLGIPLKQLKDSIDEMGTMDLATILSIGHGMALENLRKAEIRLAQIDDYLEETNRQKTLPRPGEPYERNIPQRCALTLPWTEKKFDVKRYTAAMTKLYEQAKASGLTPLYLQGLTRSGREQPWHSFLSVAIPSWLPHNDASDITERTGDGRLAWFPQGVFSGMRMGGKRLTSCFEAILHESRETDGTVVAAEMWDTGTDPADCIVEVLFAMPREHERAPEPEGQKD